MGVDGPDGWGTPLYERVLDAAGVGPGCTFLDLGCGAGALSAAAVARGARVTGVDLDPSAVAAATAAVPGAEFRVGDAHEPPPGPFDVVAIVQVLAHVANPLVLLRNAGAVGSVLAVSVWGREQECDVRAVGEALAPWLPPRRPPSGPPPVTDPDRLRRLVGMAGLEVGGVHEVMCPFTYPDADELVGPVIESGIGRHAVNRGGPVAVRAAVLDRLDERRRPDGSYVLQNLFRVLIARPA